MNKITFPLNQGESGAAVADLQDALLELVNRGALLAAEPPPIRQRLLVALRRERANQNYGETTSRLVKHFQEEKRLRPDGVVGERSAAALNTLLTELGLLTEEPRPEDPHPEQPGFEVRGRVSLADGSPAAGLKVMAVDRDLRREQALGEAQTDRNGGYHIRYSARQFQRAEKGRADLIVRVLGPDGGVLAASEILFNAPASATVDLVFAEDVLRPASEFERLDNQLAPLLDGVPLAELTAEDVAFLAGETGIDLYLIHSLVSAAKLSSATKIALNTHYGMLREGLPADLASLLQQSRSSQRHALEAAIRNKRIAPLTVEALDAALNALQDALAESALNEPEDPARPSVTRLLNSGLLPLSRNQKKAFLKLYLRPEETADDLWDTVSRLPEFQQAGQVEDLKLTLQIGNLTQNHRPLVHALQTMRKENHLGSFRELARLTPEEWMHLIRQLRDEHAPVVPQDISGDNEDEKISTYAHQISEQLESTYPTLSVAYRVERDELPGQKELTAFFKRSIIDRESLNPDIPEFDFATTAIDRYLADHANTLLAEVSDRQALTQRLKGLQRLFKVSPAYNEMKPLLQSGLHSAQSIVRLGADQFVKRFAGQLGDEARAVELYDKAEQQNAMSMAVLIKYGSLFNGVKLEVVPSVPQLSEEDLAAIPDWPSLFGSLDFCACPHCQSVYSPAAYLVDVLHFLHKRCPAKMPNESAKDTLFKRRGDIGKIELSCINTNTPVPYIDLVNEILENTVAPSTDYPQQTRDTAGEIAANPEHVNPVAYNKLRGQVFPWSLPFDCWAEQCRAYLGQLGAKRVEIMEVFSNRTRTEVLTDSQIAREYLGLNPPEWDVIIGAEEPSGLGSIPSWEYWGYPKSPNPANWLEEVAHLPVFLEKSGLSHPELLELLTTRFVNPDPKQRVLDISPKDACRLDDMRLHPQNSVTSKRLGRIHRFIRLQRKLGWTMVELDQAFTALRPLDDHGVPLPTPIFLLQLSHIERLRTTLKLPIVQILSFWSTLDAVSYEAAKSETIPSLYERLFQNKTLLGDSKEDMQAFALNHLSSASFSEHGAILTAILRISSADLTLLQAQLGLPDDLSLGSLSALYRHVILAKALKLKLPEFFVCKTLTGIDPFDPEHTENTLLFAEALQQIRLAGFSLQELNYLFLHIDNPSKGVGPSDADLSDVAEKLRNELNRIAIITRFDAPSEDLFRAHLSTVLSEEELREAFDFLDACPENTSENQKSITKHFGLFLPEEPEPDYTKLLASEKTEDVAKKQEIREQAIAYLLPYLTTYLCDLHSRTAIKQILSEILKLDKSVTTLLVDSVLLSQTNTGTSERYVINDFLGLGEEEQHAPISDTFKQSYLRLWKASVLVSRFGLSDREIEYLSQNRTDFAGFDLNQFPLELVASSTASSHFTLWRRLHDYVSLRDGVASTKVGLTDVFAQASSPDAAKQTLADATGWDIGELSALTADDLSNEVRLIRLRDQLALSHRLGVDTTTLKDWCAYPEDGKQAQEQSQTIKNALKSRYDDALWLEVAKPLRNTLREQQRSALVAYLLAREPHLKDSNDLYDHLLIDVEMSACQMTSRIRQAISSVQLFVQRCLMGLEPDVTLDEGVIAQWKWMKNYRVWEANRKVFLYPENWIEPELRDDKSPFFKEMENDLLQGEINPDTVETAFRNYLEKLDEVALLDVRAFYWQLEPGVDIIHVFARTKGGEPFTYYYRQWVDRKSWTPWEKVNVDIQGDHLVAVIYNRRLRLYWPIFEEKAEDEVNTSEEKPPKLHWEIKLAWSEYKNKKWSAKKVSDGSIRTADREEWDHKRNYAQDQYFFLPVHRSEFGPLIILCFEKPEKPISPKIDLIQAPGPEFLGLWRYTFPDTVTALGSFDVVGCHDTLFYYDVLRHLRGQSFDFSGVSEPDYQNILLSAFESPERFNEWHGLQQTMWWYNHALPNLASNSWYRNEMVVEGNDPVDDRLNLAYGHLTNRTPGQFSLHFLNQYGSAAWGFDARVQGAKIRQSILPFYYRDDTRAFWVLPELRLEEASRDDGRPKPTNTNSQNLTVSYRFQNFYHPYSCRFISELNRHGIKGVLDHPDASSALKRQFIHNIFFQDQYEPIGRVAKPYPIEWIDFLAGGAYSIYNWELFFHAPLMIADRLMKDQRFEEAQKWFHYLFDPTVGTDPVDVPPLFQHIQGLLKDVLGLLDIDFNTDDSARRYWKILPFFLNSLDQISIRQLMEILSDASNAPAKQRAREVLETTVEQWRKDPFKPHLIARLRISAYQKTVVMKYLDNLIAWADNLFRRDTIESINEATQLYILAARILGPRPTEISPRVSRSVKTYNDLEPDLDAFSNAVVQMENKIFSQLSIQKRIPPLNLKKKSFLPDFQGAAWPAVSATLSNPSLYFCIPPNEDMLEYWDTISDRLFKVRHCMNIDGVVRQLPLFEPPINPALLVKAAAAGLDIGSVLQDLYAPLPKYRYEVILQKALELCSEVKGLGAALLAALEKKDAEALSLLRANHELELLKSATQIREKQIEEAEESITALEKSELVAKVRKDHYSDLLSGINADLIGLPLNGWESAGLSLEGAAIIAYGIGMLASTSAATLHLVPNFEAGTSGGWPHYVSAQGGGNTGKAADSAASAFKEAAHIISMGAGLSLTTAGFVRRKEEWELQLKLAERELTQIQQQILVARLRKEISERELEHHARQIEKAETVRTFMQDKFTNQELYSWMAAQISGIYFQSYKLAYDVAKQAERAYRFELGLDDADYIKFGYWDNLNKGLLAGEQLHHDLKRLEVAHLDQNRRHYELTRHISLLQIDPLALIALRTTGHCSFHLPEALFDMDCPGHYFRRIKTVAVSIPCVTGPYASVNCTLTLLKSSVRTSATVNGIGYKRKEKGEDDTRFRDDFGSLQAIVTSSAQNDSGLFEPNLRDERYLPFEGSGAISEWRLELPNEYRQFDYDTISDVILHLRYTAREGGGLLRKGATSNVKELIDEGESAGSMRMFSVRHEFPAEWVRFTSQAPPDNHGYELKFALRPEHYPFWAQGKLNSVSRIDLLVRSDQSSLTVANSTIDGSPVELTNDDPALKNLFIGKFPVSESQKPTGEFKLSFDSAQLSDLWIVVSWAGGDK